MQNITVLKIIAFLNLMGSAIPQKYIRHNLRASEEIRVEVNAKVDYQTAEKICSNKNGHLATVQDVEDIKFLDNIIRQQDSLESLNPKTSSYVQFCMQQLISTAPGPFDYKWKSGKNISETALGAMAWLDHQSQPLHLPRKTLRLCTTFGSLRTKVDNQDFAKLLTTPNCSKQFRFICQRSKSDFAWRISKKEEVSSFYVRFEAGLIVACLLLLCVFGCLGKTKRSSVSRREQMGSQKPTSSQQHANTKPSPSQPKTVDTSKKRNSESDINSKNDSIPLQSRTPSIQVFLDETAKQCNQKPVEISDRKLSVPAVSNERLARYPKL